MEVCLLLPRVFDSDDDGKGRVQKPPARKLSVEGGGGVPPFSVNFFPLGFREPTVRGGGEGGTPPFR